MDKKPETEKAQTDEDTQRNHEDPGVEKEWLTEIVKEQKLDIPKKWDPTEVESVRPAKPKSQKQEYIQQFYWDLKDQLNKFNYDHETGDIITKPDEDMFDSWYEDMSISDYSQSYQLFEFFNKLVKAVGQTAVTGYGDKDDFQEAFKKIAMACIEEPEKIEKLMETINATYPRLATPYRSLPTAEELTEMEQKEYLRREAQLRQTIESNVDQYKDELAKIQRAKKTDVEKIAQQLDEMIIFGTSNWELMIYSWLSPFAPRLMIGSTDSKMALDYRSNLHCMLSGDISTAKSKILKLGKMLSPHSVTVDKTTEAEFEGAAPTKQGERIQEGLLDTANNGLIIIEEFEQAFSRLPLLRRAMDCERIQLFKKGAAKEIDVNTTLIAACNPKDDFFQEEVDLRKQIPFKEGILSRFDILVPLTATQVKNEIILPKLKLMGKHQHHGEDRALIRIRETLETLSKGMSATVTRVVLSDEQEQKIKQAFLDQNNRDRNQRGIIKGRPLVLLRDLETLARLVNVIATVNFTSREIEDGVLYADDKDVDKAIQLWENLINLRVQLYAEQDRHIESIGQEIILYIHSIEKSMENKGVNDPSVPISEVKEYIVSQRKLCGQTTFYKEINAQVEQGKLIQIGQRNKKLKVVIK